MKFLKILLGILAGLWALAMVSRLLQLFQHSDSDLASSYKLGSVAGFLFALAFCIALLSSASKS